MESHPKSKARRVAGGGGRTRTYEGLASGFTVRPLCHSGHSPLSAGPSLADENAPGWPRRGAVRLMLPKRAACQLEICRCSDGATALTLGLGASVQPIEKESFPSKESEPGKPVLRCFASPLQGAGPPTSQIPNAAPSPLSMASRPCAPPVAGRRSSRPRCRRQGSPPRRPRCGRQFRGRRRPCRSH
jgi:hypothetical protein